MPRAQVQLAGEILHREDEFPHASGLLLRETRAGHGGNKFEGLGGEKPLRRAPAKGQRAHSPFERVAERSQVGSHASLKILLWQHRPEEALSERCQNKPKDDSAENALDIAECDRDLRIEPKHGNKQKKGGAERHCHAAGPVEPITEEKSPGRQHDVLHGVTRHQWSGCEKGDADGCGGDAENNCVTNRRAVARFIGTLGIQHCEDIDAEEHHRAVGQLEPVFQNQGHHAGQPRADSPVDPFRPRPRGRQIEALGERSDSGGSPLDTVHLEQCLAKLGDRQQMCGQAHAFFWRDAPRFLGTAQRAEGVFNAFVQ